MPHATPSQLQVLESVEFDHVFRVSDTGTVYHDVTGVYAPDVFHSDTTDVEVESDKWEPLTGYTGQHAYNGAVMHASETFSGGLARDVLETPGVYVLTVVNVHPDDDDESPEPAGWAVLKLKGDN